MIAGLLFVPTFASAVGPSGQITTTGAPPAPAQPLSYDPNGMKGFGNADPTSNLTIMEPPTANNMGTAQLSYPITVPPGRQGMQPNLSINYGSGNGNSWVGYGWNLAAQSIEIDTRWGVPRYDDEKETESYQLNGSQLTPRAYRDGLEDRNDSGAKTFHMRVESKFDRIIRHGTGPTNYWWEVTDQNGTHYYFGATSTSNGPIDSATLADADGNLFKWALAEVVDISLNSVMYHYQKLSAPAAEETTGDNAVVGDQLYLSSINYTGSHLGSTYTPGKYSLTFTRESGRPDVLVSGRGGFLIVSAERLSKIEVKFQDQTIRTYQLDYEIGPFQKSLLTAIGEYGADGSEFGTHSFTYYDNVSDPNSDNYNGFQNPEDWNTHDDSVDLGHLWDGDTATALSGAVSSSFGAHSYVGFAPLNPGKVLSGGAAGGGDFSNSHSILEMLDINGDNLPDKVFEEDGTIYYRLNQSGPDGGTVFGDKVEITTLHTLSREESSSGWIGPEAYFGANAVYHHTWVNSRGTVYFKDVNQDGMIDLVDNGTVRFNHLENGKPVFTTDSDDTTVPISSGSIDLEGLFSDWLEEQKERYDRQIAMFPLVDTVRRWVAPYAGTVAIRGNVALMQDTSGKSDSYESADGVRVAIQHNATELWSTTIEADDFSPHPPSGVDDITVARGDAIYFRVQSRNDGRFDQVDWQPTIEYLNVPERTDVNGLDPYTFNAGEEFTLAGRPNIGLTLPNKGTVNLTGILNKSASTTDDLTVQLFRVPKDEDLNDEDRPDPILITEIPVAWDATGEIPITYTGLQINAGDQVRVHIKIGSRIDLSTITWNPRFHYTTIVSNDPSQPAPPVLNADGDPLVVFDAPYSMNTYPTSSLATPLEPWENPKNGTVLGLYSLSPGFPAGEMVVTAKRPIPADPDEDFDPVVGRTVIQVLPTDSTGLTAFSIDLSGVDEDDVVYFEATIANPYLVPFVQDLEMGQLLDTSTGHLTEIVPSALYTTVPPGFFGQAYRGWSYAGYNGDGAKATSPIDESAFEFDRDNYPDGPDDAPPTDETQFDWDNFDSFNNTLQGDAFPFFPSPKDNAWNGPDQFMWVRAEGISSSRFGPDYIPEPTLESFDHGSGARGVVRESDGDQDSIGVGAVVFGASFASGSSDGHVDFLDMNGDGYPDIVTDSAVQYTKPLGGLDESSTEQVIISPVRTSHTCARVLGISGDVAEFKQGPTGKVNASQASQSSSGQTRSSANNKNSSSKKNAGSTSSQPKENSAKLSFSASFSDNESQTNYAHTPGCDIAPETPNPIVSDLIDINGDGLPDRVRTDDAGDLMVAFNLGYSFTGWVKWGEATIDKGSSSAIGFGAGLGFTVGPYAFAGGVSFTMNTSIAEESFVDINGDGLADHLTTGDGSHLKVAINTGDGFASSVNWMNALDEDIADSTSKGQGGGGTVMIPIGPLCEFGCYIIINPGAEGSESLSRQESMLHDVNGDGYPDDLESQDDSNMQVALNTTGRTNLLKSVSNPLGGSMELEYERDGNTTDQPNSLWVLSKLTVDDGVHTVDSAGTDSDGADTWLTTFEYEDNVYNYLERVFYGYATVREEQRRPDTNVVYRTIVREFLNDNVYNKGLLARQYILDESGNTYDEKVNTYRLWDVMADAELSDPGSTSATVFPQLIKIEHNYFEGGSTAQKSTFTAYQYDSLGNVTQSFDAGEPDPSDDLIVNVGFPDTCTDTYVYDVPTSIKITDHEGNVLRDRERTVPCNLGVPTEIRQQIGNGELATTNLSYFDNGNVKTITWPQNQSGQRYSLTYEYDPSVQTHVTKMTDSFGYQSTATYNLLYGSLASETDINGNVTSYVYDQFGRLTNVTGPYQQGGSTPTTAFEYHLPGSGVPVAWTSAKHIDMLNPGETIDTAQFADGLGRIIQTKREADLFASVDATSPQHVMIVSGWQRYDFLGRIIEQYHPVTEPIGQIGTLNPNLDSVDPNVTTYDVMDRVTKEVHPSGTIDTYAYGFGQDRAGRTMFQTRWTDALQHDRDYFHNVRRKQTSLRMFQEDENPGSAIWTSYTYNPLGGLVSITDAENNVTSMTYDMLGRRTSTNNPNAGLTELRYDPASNVIAKITSNLRAEGQQISYGYDFNRLQSINYPDFPENNVSYTYGEPGATDNRASRITLVTYEAGSQERFYGKLGEVVKQIDTVVSQTGPGPGVYTTEFSYDTWDRLGTVVYPDGEVLTYTYDHGGKVNHVSGEKAGTTYPYVDRLEYDKHDHQKYLVMGNGATTLYSYAETWLGLIHQNTMSGPKPLQDTAYQYDSVGNLLKSDNTIPVPPPSEYGGPSLQNYEYDDLNRLKSADGAYQYSPNKAQKYDLDFSYDVLGNITSKVQKAVTIQPSGKEKVLDKLSYNRSYAYEAAQPNALTHITEQRGNNGNGRGGGPKTGGLTYIYDQNGNQLGWDDDNTGQRRTIVWDEENRMQSLADNGRTFTFAYNDVGQRIKERGMQGETAYVNPFFTVRNGTQEMKHIFLGTRRIASQRAMADGTFEHFQYFYHADRQGSANYITDENGQVYEHLEYFPTGEAWIEEQSNQWRVQHLYTGQKWDEQTGLYYYGARFYDPRVSQFLSSDPQFMKQPAQSLTDPMFLNTYAYVNNNPSTLVDPSGGAARSVSNNPVVRSIQTRINRMTSATRTKVQKVATKLVKRSRTFGQRLLIGKKAQQTKATAQGRFTQTHGISHADFVKMVEEKIYPQYRPKVSKLGSEDNPPSKLAVQLFLINKRGIGKQIWKGITYSPVLVSFEFSRSEVSFSALGSDQLNEKWKITRKFGGGAHSKKSGS